MSLSRRALYLSISICVASACLLVLYRHFTSPVRDLPYHDSFRNNSAEEWSAFGGNWALRDGVMRNDSNDLGAKLVTGLPAWSNYSLEADVQLLPGGETGEAGLLIRSRKEEEGVDAYFGYYAGLRLLDNALVLGRADYEWHELAVASIPGNVKVYNWYHFKVEGFGCLITVTVKDIATGVTTSVAVNDDQGCIPSGRIGLRSHWGGGIWRNIRVQPLSSLPVSFSSAGTLSTGGQVQNSSHLALQKRDTYVIPRFFLRDPPEGTFLSRPAKEAEIRTIRSLQLLVPPFQDVVTVRGVVTLSSPELYVQDATGGIAVVPVTETHFKLGDQVEVSGRIKTGPFSSSLYNASARRLWDQAPIPPISVTADQAATGAYDGMFVEVDGYLSAKHIEPDGTIALDLDTDHQSFRAFIYSGRGNSIGRKALKGSLLRFRGICVVDPSRTHNITPFVLLVRSTDDVKVIAGPPWYSIRYLIFILLILLVLVLSAYLLYIRVRHWRFRAIVMERERLGHEMHDTLAQSFAGIGFQLQAVRNRIRLEDRELIQPLDLARDLARKSHDEARLTVSTLRSGFLETGELHLALRAVAERLVEGGDIVIVAQSAGDGRHIPFKIKDALYRIGREAIANCIRHADPQHILVRVEYKRSSVELSIDDDGKGFSPPSEMGGFGLGGMRKRAESIAAFLEIESAPGSGTRIRVTTPFQRRLTIRL
jgi:signal transduction histidine kinase